MTNGIGVALLMLWPPALGLIVQQRASRFFMEVGMPGAKCQPLSISSPKPKPRQKRNATVTHIQARNPLDFQSVDDWLRAIKMERYILFSRVMGLTAPTCVCS